MSRQSRIRTPLLEPGQQAATGDGGALAGLYGRTPQRPGATPVAILRSTSGSSGSGQPGADIAARRLVAVLGDRGVGV